MNTKILNKAPLEMNKALEIELRKLIYNNYETIFYIAFNIFGNEIIAEEMIESGFKKFLVKLINGNEKLLNLSYIKTAFRYYFYDERKKNKDIHLIYAEEIEIKDESDKNIFPFPNDSLLIEHVRRYTKLTKTENKIWNLLIEGKEKPEIIHILKMKSKTLSGHMIEIKRKIQESVKRNIE